MVARQPSRTIAPMVLACALSWRLATAARPHILLMLADDLGHTCVGYNAPDSVNPPEIRTPSIDRLARGGVILSRHYSFKFCSPTRSALQSGRLPVHVNVENAEPECVNPKDPVSGFAGIPVNMTSMPAKLQALGYSTYATGKWDAGMAHIRQGPAGRGYQKWLGYFHHANDYYSEGLPLASIGTVNVCDNKFVDMWDTDRPATGLNGTAYEPEIFANHSIAMIEQHDPATPMFLFHAFHLIHTPLEVPTEWLANFSFINNKERQSVAAMTSYMDDVVAKLVAALEGKRMWESTLAVFVADNGGAIYSPAGGNNWPLRGGKFSDFEGGIRTVGFVSGGAVPPPMQGTMLHDIISIADWLATFCEAAGGGTDCVADPEAERLGLPKIDSISHWGVLNGSVAPSGGSGSGARSVLHASDQAVISGNWKLVVGIQPMSGWTGPQYPNNTGPQPTFIPKGWQHDCHKGCLYNVSSDPTEHDDLADTHPSMLSQMQNLLNSLNKNNFSPNRGLGDKRACAQAESNGGYYGPFIGI